MKEPPVLVFLLILVCIVGAWWLYLLAAPSKRRWARFIYNTDTTPDALNGASRGDDITHPAAPEPAEDAHWPSVTVIVPGRNEGHLLARTLGSLCAMQYPRYRVVFVDDQSTDDTAEVCRELETRFPHLTVIHNTQPPTDGWIGKTWAVHQAQEYMNDGDYLLFTDSDLEFHPQCLRQAVRLALHRNTDVTSMLPRLRCETFGELLGLLTGMVIINARMSLDDTNNPRKPTALVAGGFFLVKRAVYHEMGGHASVRGHVVEDVAFGTRAKALGRRVYTVLTHDLYTARMYEGWRDTFRGLKKNAYAGANYNPLFAVVVLAFLVFFGVFPMVYAAWGVTLAVREPRVLTLALAVGGTGALAMQLAVAFRTARTLGMSLHAGWAIPLGFLFYTAIFVGSVTDHYLGGNTWSGRRIRKAQPLVEAGRIK